MTLAIQAMMMPAFEGSSCCCPFQRRWTKPSEQGHTTIPQRSPEGPGSVAAPRARHQQQASGSSNLCWVWVYHVDGYRRLQLSTGVHRRSKYIVFGRASRVIPSNLEGTWNKQKIVASDGMGCPENLIKHPKISK